MNKLKIYFALFLLTVISSCALHTHTKKITSKRIYENFYVGDDGNQWYVHPVMFKNKTTNFLMDFTFRDTNLDSVMVKYSILSKDVVDDPKIVKMSLENQDIMEIRGDKKIFAEFKDGVYHLRYATNITFEQLKNIVRNVKEVQIDGRNTALIPTKSALKRLNEVNNQVIRIVEKY